TSTSGCDGTSTAISIEVTPEPTTSSAGADQLNLCGITSTTLTANTPANGAGTWSVVSGSGGVFGSTTSPTSSFDGTAGETYVLRWTIANTNGQCTPSTDEVTIRFQQSPATADAGPVSI